MGSSPTPGTTRNLGPTRASNQSQVNKVANFRTLATILAAGAALAAYAQPAGIPPKNGTPAGVVQPGSQYAGVLPKLNPQTGLPYPTGSYESFWPGFRPISSVPVLLTGTSPAVNRSMTYVLAGRNEWERLYRELNPPLPGEQVYAPAYTDFSDEVLIVVRLAGTSDLDVVPTIDSVERLDGVTSLVRYSIWMPFRGTPRGGDQGVRTISVGDAVKEAFRDRNPQSPPDTNQDKPKEKRELKPVEDATPPRLANISFSPYVVIKAPRTSGWFRFSGQIQNYKPYRPHRRDRDGD